MHFRRMDEGTDEDFALLAAVHEENIRALPDLLLGMLADLTADAAYTVNRLEHSSQGATRALRDDRDEEYVVCCLLHDVGESLGPFNHGEVVGSILQTVRLERPTTGCWPTTPSFSCTSSASISGSIRTNGIRS